jgi:hypothetical protein
MILPPDFLDRLKAARAFTGAFAEAAPWQRHVILHGGKLYASNNKQIVEIDCGIEGSAILTKKMATLITAMQGTPATIEIGEWVHFGWENGRYLKVKNEYDHDDIVARLTELLDQWQGSESIATVDLAGIGRGIAVTDGPTISSGALPPRNGFFYSGKGTPSSRLVHGEVDLRLDDLFGIRLSELAASKKAIEREIDRLADEQVRIERLQSEARKKLEAHERDVDRLNEALAKYHSKVELDDSDRELLRPACETTIRKEESDERRETLKKVSKELPGKIKDWDRYSETSDGEYAYVTFRRRLPAADVRPSIKKRIAETLNQVFAPDFPRDELFKGWPSLGSIEARAGPS